MDLTGTTALVTGASRGIGRATAVALHRAGARVVAVARTRSDLDQLHAELGDRVVPVVADATDPAVAQALLAQHRPTVLVLNAGTTPQMLPLSAQTWDSFRAPWEVDVRHAFAWVRASLLLPLAPGSTVVTLSSGAALRGSPLSGGYAGAKATIRFLTAYAAGEAERSGLDVRYVAALPGLTATTALGAAAAEAYARQEGTAPAAFAARLGPGAEQVAAQLVALVGAGSGAYVLTPDGPSPVP